MKAAKIQSPQQQPAPESTPAGKPQAPTAIDHAIGNSSTLTSDDLKVLSAPFAKDRLHAKVQSLSKDKTRALLVLYLQHTDVQDRLDQVDPTWSWQIVGEERLGDTVYIRGRLTIKGVSRENVGEGQDPKASASDALKRCAMLFGVGRYLYDSPTVWANYDESRDRFRTWTVDDFERPSTNVSSSSAARANKESARQQQQQQQQQQAAPQTGARKSRPREELNRVLMNLYRPYLTQFPQTQFSELLKGRYNVGETRLMTVEQLEDLVKFMETKLQSVA